MVSHSLSPSVRTTSVHRLSARLLKVRLDLLAEGPCIIATTYTINFPRSIILRNMPPFTRDCAPGERNTRTSQRLLDTNFDVIIFPRYPKFHCDPPVRVGVYSDQVIDGGLAQLWLTVGSQSPGPQCVFFPVPDCTIQMGRHDNWEKLYFGSLTHGVRIIIVGRAKKKPLELSLSTR